MKLTTDAEKAINENGLYKNLIESCREGLILYDKKKKTILLINDRASQVITDNYCVESSKISDIIFAEILPALTEENTAELEINDNFINVRSISSGEYMWIFLADFSNITQIKAVSEKLLKLNDELLNTFNTHSDDTLLITDGNGIIEFAGEQIINTCDVSSDFFYGKSVYDMEQQNIFYPSVCVKVLKTKAPQAVIQTTKTGEEVVAVGSPVFNSKGAIEKVLSVTRNYSTQLEISKMIAELQISSITSDTSRDENIDNIVTCNDKMFEIKTLIKMIAPTKATVLINGETGTGKGLIAKYIHKLSDRKNQPFIVVNCGSLSHSIIESELFGYEEGSFTGASKGGKVGLIESANNGTLFLDEISELPMLQQVKLLHVLQERTLTHVGGTESIDLDIRIIAATNKSLDEQVSIGEFREDLYYRLNVIPIHIPPLRKRKEDIPLLANYFFKANCNIYNKKMQLSSSVLTSLSQHPWPGNIRQLQNTIERLVLTTSKPIITASDLPDDLRIDDSTDPIKVERVMKLDEAISSLEKNLISMALDEYGTTVRVAEALGVNQSTVSRKIHQYGLKNTQKTD